MDRQEYRLAAEAIRHLKPKYSQSLALAVFQEERRHPYHQCDESARSKLPLSMLLEELCTGYPPAVVRLLDDVGVCLRDYSLYERAIHLFTLMGDSCERQGYLVGLARSWMWRGRCLTDKGDRLEDLRCYWRAMSILSHLYANAELSEADRRDVAQGLSSIQHQFAVRCKDGDDLALLYNYRALALRDQLGIAHLQSGSHHNVALQYRNRKDYDHALLHFLQAIRLDICGANDQERRITYTSLGAFAQAMFDTESALLFYRKAATFGSMTFSISFGIAATLLALGRHDELLRDISDFINNDMLSPFQQVQLRLIALQSMRAVEPPRPLDEAIDQIITTLIECEGGLTVKDPGVVERIEARLKDQPDMPHRHRAILLRVVGKPAEAMVEIEAGLSSNPGDSELKLLQTLRDEISLQIPAKADDSEPQDAVPENAPRCRACGSPISPDGSGEGRRKGEGLCSVCDEALCLEDMVYIPAGKAVAKDCLEADIGAFMIDRYPVTNRLFRLYHKVCKPGYDPLCWQDRLYDHPDQPITCLTPKDCEAFCQWRSRLNGQKYRLPTQEEWFRAALGSDGRTYPWGDEPPDYTRAAFSVIEDREAVPPPVGLFPAGASPFGVMDMAGTVWEYTSTFDKDGKIIYLGGSCDCEPANLTPNQEFYRAMIPQNLDDRTDRQMGFRCVMEVDSDA